MKSDAVASRETVRHALSDHAASTKALLDADFTVFDTAELLAIQSERELRARADEMIGHRIQAALMDRATAHEIGGKSWVDVLATRMRISRAEAARRVSGAEVLGPRHAIGGEVLEPVLAACAAALAEGSICAGHIKVVRATMKTACGRMSGTELADLEVSLVAAAKTTTPETLEKAAERVLYKLNQDGHGPDVARHKRGITLGPQDADGLVRITGWVDAELAAYLGTAQEVWGRPGVNNPDDAEPQLNPDPNPLEDEPGPACELRNRCDGTNPRAPTVKTTPPMRDSRIQPVKSPSPTLTQQKIPTPTTPPTSVPWPIWPPAIPAPGPNVCTMPSRRSCVMP